MKIINLIKSEFIKRYKLKKIILIVLTLIISTILVIDITNTDTGYNGLIRRYSENDYKVVSNDLEEIKNKNNKRIFDLYHEYYFSNYVEFIAMSIKNNNTWDREIIDNTIMQLISDNYLIDYYLNNREEYNKYCEELEYDIEDICHFKTNLVEKSDEELNSIKEINAKRINNYKDIIKENKYYKYLEFEVANGLIQKTKYTDFIINNKISNFDYFLEYNNSIYNSLEKCSNIEIIDKKDFINKNVYSLDDKSSAYYSFNNYDLYKNYIERVKNECIKDREIIYYSSTNNLKHDVSYDFFRETIRNDTSYKINAKYAVNNIYHFSSIIMVILSIVCGGIVSDEHNNGTIKNLISMPIKRWKILLSKYLYLIINALLLFIIELLILWIITGLKFGFTDILTNKIIVINGNATEINYILYLIKNIMICMIPMMCFLSVLLFLSTITLNTSTTVGITSLVSIFSYFVWRLRVIGNIKQIVYTPFFYFDLGFILNNSYRYDDALMIMKFDLKLGLLICIITSIIFYTITNIIYSKRDIKM